MWVYYLAQPNLITYLSLRDSFSLPDSQETDQKARMTSLSFSTQCSCQANQNRCAAPRKFQRVLKESFRIRQEWNKSSSLTALRLSFFILKIRIIQITVWHHLWGINEITCVKPLPLDLVPERLPTTSGCYYPLIRLTRHSQRQVSTCCSNAVVGWQHGKLSRSHPRRGSRAEVNKLTGMSLSHCGIISKSVKPR